MLSLVFSLPTAICPKNVRALRKWKFVFLWKKFNECWAEEFEVDGEDVVKKEWKAESEFSRWLLSFLLKSFFFLPTRLIADTSKPFRVSFSHFPFVWDLLAGFSIGEPGASPSRKTSLLRISCSSHWNVLIERGGEVINFSTCRFSSLWTLTVS